MRPYSRSGSERHLPNHADDNCAVAILMTSSRAFRYDVKFINNRVQCTALPGLSRLPGTMGAGAVAGKTDEFVWMLNNIITGGKSYGRSKSPLATENLLENTDGVLRLSSPLHQCSLGGSSLLPSIYADVRYIDDVIAIEGLATGGYNQATKGNIIYDSGHARNTMLFVNTKRGDGVVVHNTVLQAMHDRNPVALTDPANGDREDVRVQFTHNIVGMSEHTTNSYFMRVDLPPAVPYTKETAGTTIVAAFDNNAYMNLEAGAAMAVNVANRLTLAE